MALLRGLTGKPEGSTRALLGRLLKTARDDCPAVMRALREAADLRPVEPVAWLTAALSRPDADQRVLAVLSNANDETERLWGGLPH